MRFRRFAYILLGLALAIFVINAPYFLAQLKYYFNDPVPVHAPVAQDSEARVEPDRLWIESLGIEAPIIYVEEEDEAKFQEGLRSGVVHYPGTADVGKSGNSYIFGHSSDFVTAKGDYKTVFALLPRIETGSIISVSDRDGRLFKYKVDRKFAVSSKDTSVLAQDLSRKQLTLQTSYPVGTALRRYIVISYLVE
jgi:LPXTG-site transpeptidase (sortase) family protein